MRSWTPIDQCIGHDELEAELDLCENSLCEEFAEIRGHSLRVVFSAIVETYQPQGNELGLAELLGCSPMEAYRISRRVLPRILAQRPRLLRALAQASGVPISGVVSTVEEERWRMVYEPMDEDERNQLVGALFAKFEDVFRVAPYEDIVVEFTGSIQSAILLHMVWRYFRRRMRVTPFFVSAPIEPLHGVHDYMRMMQIHYGLEPIEIHLAAGMEGLFFERGTEEFKDELLRRVGPGGLGFKYIMRAVACDPVFDMTEAYERYAAAAHPQGAIVVGTPLLHDWPREALIGYVDHHQLDGYQPALVALMADRRLEFTPPAVSGATKSRGGEDALAMKDLADAAADSAAAQEALRAQRLESVTASAPMPTQSTPSYVDGWSRDRNGRLRLKGRLVKKADIPAEVVAYFQGEGHDDGRGNDSH